MKTLEEFFKEVAVSDELKNELDTVKNKEALEAFFRKHDCGASAEEFLKVIEPETEGELSDDDAEAAAGGKVRLIANSVPPEIIKRAGELYEKLKIKAR